MRHVHLQRIFEPRDLWIGAYVERPWWEMGRRFHGVYFALLPTVVIRLTWSTAP